MEIKPMIKGAAVGMMAGTAFYMVAKSPDRKKKMLKKSTGKAIKAFGSAVDFFSSMIG